MSCTVTHNRWPTHMAVVEGNTFRYNTSGVRGAALQAYRVPDLTIQNNLFVGNQCSGSDDTGGGAIAAEWSSSVIVNNTFVQNWVGTLDGNGPFPAAGEDIWANVIPAAYGGAILIRGIWSYAPPAVVLNNIFYDNVAAYGRSVACIEGGVANISYCDAYADAQPSTQPEIEQYHYAYATYGEYHLGSRVLYLASGFYDLANGKYWLGASSQLRQDTNRGQSHSVNPVVPSIDIFGHARAGTQYTDMGAYESLPGNYP